MCRSTATMRGSDKVGQHYAWLLIRLSVSRFESPADLIGFSALVQISAMQMCWQKRTCDSSQPASFQLHLKSRQKSRYHPHSLESALSLQCNQSVSYCNQLQRSNQPVSPESLAIVTEWCYTTTQYGASMPLYQAISHTSRYASAIVCQSLATSTAL